MKPGTRGIPGGSIHSAIFPVQRHFFGDIAYGQVDDELPVMGVPHDDALALKGNGGIALHIEEVCRTEVLIALGIARSDTCSLDADFGLGAGQVVFIEFHSALKLLELSPD